MAATSFSATVDAWVLKTKERSEAVFKKSAERLSEEVKNPANLPVVTGFLRRSLMASTASMPSLDTKTAPDDKVKYPDNQGEINLVINGSSLGDTIFLGFTAVYARRLNYGFTGTDSLGRKYNQAGKQFAGLAAQKWPQIVSEVVRQAKERVS